MAERNAQCPCGSGRKYKVCCGIDNKKRTNWKAASIVIVFLLGAGWAVSTALMDLGAERELPDGWVWHEEHGHPHRVGGDSAFVEPPEGSVWVAEHGHFHDANGNPIGGATPTPENPPVPTN